MQKMVCPFNNFEKVVKIFEIYPTSPFSQILRKHSDFPHTHTHPMCHSNKGAEPLKGNHFFSSLHGSVFFQAGIQCAGLHRQLHANLLGARRFVYYIQAHRRSIEMQNLIPHESSMIR